MRESNGIVANAVNGLWNCFLVIFASFLFREKEQRKSKNCKHFLFSLISLDVSRSRSDAKHTTIVISNERGQQSVLDLIQFFCASCDGSCWQPNEQ
jgi:hypothetical protein